METLSFRFIIAPLAAHRHICHSAAAITDPNEGGAASAQLRSNHKHVYGLLHGDFSERRFNSRWLFTGTFPECSSRVSDAPPPSTHRLLLGLHNSGMVQPAGHTCTCGCTVHSTPACRSPQVLLVSAKFAPTPWSNGTKNGKQKLLDRVGRATVGSSSVAMTASCR